MREPFNPMRIVRYSNYIKKQKRKSIWMAVIGFITLSAAMFIAMMPGLLIVAYVAMIGGFITFNLGMQGVGKWTRNPRNDQIFDVRMKSLTDQVTLIHYAKPGKRVVEHLAVYPGGLLVLNGKEVDGNIVQRGAVWRKKGGLFRRLFAFSGPQLGNPSFENDRAVASVEEWLAEQHLEVDVKAATVFLHPRVDLEVEKPDYPVLHGEEVDEFIRDLPDDEHFTQDEKNQLLSLLTSGQGVEQPEQQKASRRPRPTRRVAGPKPSQVKRKSA